MHTKVNWFEIPAADFERAVCFYETIFDTTLRRERGDPGGADMALFCDADGESRGCISFSKDFVPGLGGTLVYLDGGAAFDFILQRIASAGGTIKLDKLQLPGEIGCIAHFIDSEGNLVALHAYP
jgi:predicted enzyme related to lactoylglutathione lyase